MSNPYGGDPYGADPYGGAPYGGDPYAGAYGAPGPYGYGGPPPGPSPDNNLVWGILCTVLCCLPFGIVSIVKATSVDKLWAMGDYAGAQKAASDAGKWALWGAISAVVMWVLFIVGYVVFILLLVGAASTSGTY